MGNCLTKKVLKKLLTNISRLIHNTFQGKGNLASKVKNRLFSQSKDKPMTNLNQIKNVNNNMDMRNMMMRGMMMPYASSLRFPRMYQM